MRRVNNDCYWTLPANKGDFHVAKYIITRVWPLDLLLSRPYRIRESCGTWTLLSLHTLEHNEARVYGGACVNVKGVFIPRLLGAGPLYHSDKRVSFEVYAHYGRKDHFGILLVLGRAS